MPGIDFRQLRREITIQQVLEALNFECVQRRGDQWYGACPLHQSPGHHSRSFSVNVAIGCYYCHTCRSGGNQLKLCAEATRLPLHPSAIQLCQQLAREVPWLLRPRPQRRKP